MKKTPEKLLLLDIGNTSVSYAFYEGARLSPAGCFKSGDIPKFIKKFASSGKKSNIKVIFVSVVPKLSLLVRKLARACRVPALEAGRDLELPLQHRYRKRKQLGPDRQICVYAALRIYRPPFIILDFGTAITVDYVSAKGIFEGGMIIPGPEIAFRSLVERAARIPSTSRLRHRPGTAFLGRSTADCLQTGILQGYGAMTDGLIDRFRSRYGPKVRSIATGGFTRLLKPYVFRVDRYDPDLSLKGLLLLYKASR